MFKKILYSFFSFLFLIIYFPELSGSVNGENFFRDSNNETAGKIYELSIKSEYLDFIINGVKTIEIRVDVPKLSKIDKNDLIYFYDDSNRCSLCQVVYVRKYRSFDDLLAMEGIVNAIPEMEVDNKSGCELITQGVAMIDGLPGYKEKVKVYGALAIKISYLNFCTKRPPKLISVNGA